MNEARIIDVWKQFGKIIRLGEIGVAAASGVKEHSVAMTAQFTQNASGPDDYAPITTYIVPLAQKLGPVVSALDRVESIGRTSLDSYLHTLAPELALSDSASTETILEAFADAMTGAAVTIQPSGKLWNYFRDAFTFDGFPGSDSPDVDDTIITTTIL